MSDSAITAYIRTMRIIMKVSQQDLARAMGLSLRQLNRWENSGTENLRSDALFRAATYLGASLEHLSYLAQPDATPDEARQLADKWLSERELSHTITDSDALQIIEAALSLRQDRPRLAQLALAARRLVQERELQK